MLACHANGRGFKSRLFRMYIYENNKYNLAYLGLIIFFIFLLGEISILVESLAALKETSNQEIQKLLLEIKILEEQQLAEVEKLNKFSNDLLLELKENSVQRREEHDRAMQYNYVSFIILSIVPFAIVVTFSG